jgi:hypothetical protein
MSKIDFQNFNRGLLSHGLKMTCFNTIFKDQDGNPFGLKEVGVWLVLETEWERVVNPTLANEVNVPFDPNYKCTIVDYEFLHYQDYYDNSDPLSRVKSIRISNGSRISRVFNVW